SISYRTLQTSSDRVLRHARRRGYPCPLQGFRRRSTRSRPPNAELSIRRRYGSRANPCRLALAGPTGRTLLQLVRVVRLVSHDPEERYQDEHSSNARAYAKLFILLETGYQPLVTGRFDAHSSRGADDPGIGERVRGGSHELVVQIKLCARRHAPNH